ncbi:pLS20_p028 family conjugation system transmembrane protein, partial [Bacillus toyonensis]|uniref:pLS20_p028 family conjugation system transmembrane protein n=1 Tax=Bacillus toyonensis TaxID=155322 RepID=UPI002E23813F|nr:hypothetical protein [Bacillus toyonensis]
MKSKKNLLYSFVASLLGVFFIVPCTVNAEWDWLDFFGTKDSDIPKILEFLHNDWIRYTDFMGSIIQSFMGGIVKFLLGFVSLIEGLIPETFSIFDLLKDSGLNEFYTSMVKGLFYSILVLMIVWMAIRVMIQHNPPKFKTVGINILVMIGLLGGLNELMADMQGMATDFYKGSVEEGKAKEGLAWDIVKDNTADLLYLSQVGFDAVKNDKSSKPKNNMSKDEFLEADLSDLLTLKVIEDISKEGNGMAAETNYLTYKISHTGKEQTVSKIEKASMFNPFKDSFESGYKRYPMQFFTIFWALLALSVAYLFTLFVFVITIFELVMKKIVAPFVMVTDIDSGQKTKMMIQDIGQGFLTIAFTGLSLRFFTISVNFVANKDLNPILFVVALVCLTIALIKGSNTILKYFGVDVGLKEGMNGVLATVGGLSLAKRAGTGVKNMLSSASDSITSKQSREDTPKRSQMSSENMLSEDDSVHSNSNKSTPTRNNMTRNTGAIKSASNNNSLRSMAIPNSREQESDTADYQMNNKNNKSQSMNNAPQQDQKLNDTQSVEVDNKQVEQGNSTNPVQASQDENLRRMQTTNVEKKQVEQGNPMNPVQASQDENLRRMQTTNVEKKQVEQGNPVQASQDENLRRLQTMNVEKKQVEQGANPTVSRDSVRTEGQRIAQETKVDSKVVQGANPTVSRDSVRTEGQRI